MKGKRDHGIYLLNGQAVTRMTTMKVQSLSKTSLWHQRNGHLSLRGMHILGRQGMLGVDKICDLEFCEHCEYEKMHKVKFSIGNHCSKGILE